MEAKVSARSNKKSAGGSGTADRKKSNRKKKKDKRKQSLRGGESKESDVQSPDFDSEVQAEVDNSPTDQGEGHNTPVGKVTKLPLLGSQSSVSLIAQGVNTSAANRYPLPDKPVYTITSIQQPSSTTTTTTSTRANLTTIPISTAAVASTDSVEVTVSRVANLTVKRSSKGRSKQSSKSHNKSSRNKDRHAGGVGKGGTSTNTTTSSTTSGSSLATSASSTSLNESLRWESVLEDTEKERERIAMYKMNRRKRYLKAAQAKGLGWAMNYTMATISPMSEDSGVDTTCASPGNNYVDFGAINTLRPMAPHRGLAEAFVEC